MKIRADQGDRLLMPLYCPYKPIDPKDKIAEVQSHPGIGVEPLAEEQGKSKESKVKAERLPCVEPAELIARLKVHGNGNQGANHRQVCNDGDRPGL